MNTYPIRLSGMGTAFPERVVHSTELEAELDLDPGTILKTVGVETRHRASPDETTASLGARALNEAMKDASIGVGELDLLINANVSYDYPLPATSCLIQRALADSSAVDVPCMNVHSSCISFVAALEVASALITVGSHRRIAIVSSEISSKSISPEQSHAYGLFGDAAAAFIVERSESASALGGFRFRTYSEGAYYTYIPGGGNVRHPKEGLLEAEMNFQMAGRNVLRFSIRKIREFVDRYEQEIGRCLSSFPVVVPHQASRAGLEMFQREFGLADSVHTILRERGNCVAASIPLALHDAIASGRVRRGDEVLLFGSAAGITIGACWLRY